MQTRSCAALWTPPRSINASHVFARQLNRTRDEPGVSRKVWSAIVFGFELEINAGTFELGRIRASAN